MTPAERFALMHYLTEWPDDMEFDDVLETIGSDDPDIYNQVLVWEPFEYYMADSLCGLIEQLRDDAQGLIDDTRMAEHYCDEAAT